MATTDSSATAERRDAAPVLGYAAKQNFVGGWKAADEAPRDPSSYVCTIYDLFKKFAWMSPDVYSECAGVSQFVGDSPDDSFRCPTYYQVTHSDSLSIKVKKDDTSTGTSTYRFNGRRDQLPRLRVVGQRREDAAYEDPPEKDGAEGFNLRYVRESLVRLKDVRADWTAYPLTLIFENVPVDYSKLTAKDAGSVVLFDMYDNYTDNFPLDPDGNEFDPPKFRAAYSGTDYAEAVFDTAGPATACDLSVVVDEKASVMYSDYDPATGSGGIDMYVNGTLADSNVPFSYGRFGRYIADLTLSNTIRFVGKKKKLIPVSIVSDGHFKLTDESGDVVMRPGEYYATASTTYENPTRLTLLVEAESDDYESFQYEWHDAVEEEQSFGETVTVDGVTGDDDETLRFIAKEAFKPRTFYVVDKTGIDKTANPYFFINVGYADEIDPTTGEYRTMEEGGNSVVLVCRGLPAGYTGWRYATSRNSVASKVYPDGNSSGGESGATVQITSDGMRLYVYASKINVAEVRLSTSGGAYVFDNLAGEAASDGQIFSPPETPSSMSFSFSNVPYATIIIERRRPFTWDEWEWDDDDAMSSAAKRSAVFGADPGAAFPDAQTGAVAQAKLADKFTWTLTPMFKSTGFAAGQSLSETHSFAEGYTLAKDDLSTDSDRYYNLVVTGFRDVVKKSLTVVLDGTAVGHARVEISNADSTPDYSTESGRWMCRFPTFTPGTAKYSLVFNDAETASTYAAMTVSGYVSSSKTATTSERVTRTETVKLGEDGVTCAGGEFSFESIPAYDDADQLFLEISPAQKANHLVHVVLNDGLTYKRYDKTGEALTGEEVSEKTSVAYTDYTSPAFVKFRIYADEFRSKCAYSVHTVGGTQISAGTAALEKEPGTNRRFADYQTPAGIFESYDSGDEASAITIEFSAAYDSMLFWRSVRRPLTVRGRSAGAERIVPRRTQN